ncbi:MAG: DUF4272 domain-containing protein [Betaproteobacteria bacterium]|nr:MAG: DUF4272 domain-containing protein [Betaproteobacteria bacterium]
MHLILRKAKQQQRQSDAQNTAAIQRKERSERILSSEGVPVNPDLPLLEVRHGAGPRDKEEVALRTLCVLMTAIKAERMDQTMVLRVVRQYGLAAYFSREEKDFIRDPQPSEKQRSRFLWRYEAAWTLLWSLGYVKILSIPRDACDVAFAVSCMRDRNAQAFIANAKQRPFDQVLDQADLIYRYHWSLVDATLAKRATPVDLNAGIVYERHYALNWLKRHHDQDWDSVTTDSGGL